MTEPWIENGSLKFRGIDMYKRFGIRVLDCDYDFILPSPRVSKVKIPKRSGQYDFGSKTYDERKINLSCESENEQGREYWRELSYILSKKGKLYIYSEPDIYYTGRIYDPSELQRVRNTGMGFDLVFTCEPFAYRNIITERFTNNVYIPNYQGTAVTPTRIEITNSNAVAATSIRIVQVRKIESEG